MSTLAGIEFFAATVDAGSFAAAAKRLGVTASAVSRRVAQLEEELGVALLARTTRSLSLTNDGRAFHERCTRILEELRDARDTIAHARKKPSGVLRVDAPIALGRMVLSPRVPEFLNRYPEIKLELTLRDIYVDPVPEGIDVLLRIGPLGESNLIAKRLGTSRLVPCAAPAYLKKHGMPKTPADIVHHDCLGYLRQGRPDPWCFEVADGTRNIDIRGPYHADDGEVLRDAAIAGKGLIALFDFMVGDAVTRGALVPILTEHPMSTRPIHALYPKNRHLLPKVRVFLDFAAKLFTPTRQAPHSADARSPREG